MSTSAPPKLAAWLLIRFIPDPTLIGDLIEGKQRGRSVAWFWKQTLWAIAAQACADLRTEKMLTIRCGTLAFSGLVLWTISTRARYQWVSMNWVNTWVAHLEVLTRHWHYYGGHLHLVWCAGAALVAWTIVRRQREHIAGAFAMAVAFQIPFALWWGVPLLLSSLADPQFPWSVPHLVVALFVVVGLPLAASAGALAGADNEGRKRIQMGGL